MLSRFARIPANMVVPLAPPSPTTKIPKELWAVGAASAAIFRVNDEEELGLEVENALARPEEAN